jgi:hypothetical protein
MPADEDGSLRRRLARDMLTSVEWDADGTFTVRLHTHPPGDPCPPDGCGQAEPAHPPGDQPDRAPEHDPHYCTYCGTVWYTRHAWSPQAGRCSVCGTRTPAGGTGDSSRGLMQFTMVFGRAARLVVHEVAEPVTTGQLVGLHPGGGVRPWAGDAYGIALMDAAAGSLAVVAVPEDPGYPVPGDVLHLEAHGIFPEDPACPVPDDAQVAIPLDALFHGYTPYDPPGATPDGATLARAAAYGEDPFVNAAEAARQPGPLDTLAPDTPLLIAAGPGPAYFAWRHVAPGVWIAAETEPAAPVKDGDPSQARLTTAAAVRKLLHDKGETAR